ncbi:hypothetical protein M569_17061 [Genlisea aurea]|uniref:YbaK/aminoacyl-tRNA synthetase-associated domain-containing protein n=1 Tax=Genlisea aurea TaxID=192259 RepID=S8BZX1_9LAMI|nr:hypothetical protein M569_17061 [Genlisea aurea]
MEFLAELEGIQTRILRRISDLELSILHEGSTGITDDAESDSDFERALTTEERLSGILRADAVVDFSFKRVPSDYYERTYESRRDILGAASIHHLCKSIVLVNTQAPGDVVDCSDRNFSKYYVVVVQYTARFNAEAVKSFLYTINNGKIPKKRINMRLAPEETSEKLTGYMHNGVTCIGRKTDIPVILDEAIVMLKPDFFWLGGGETDLKLGISSLNL